MSGRLPREPPLGEPPLGEPPLGEANLGGSPLGELRVGEIAEGGGRALDAKRRCGASREKRQVVEAALEPQGWPGKVTQLTFTPSP